MQYLLDLAKTDYFIIGMLLFILMLFIIYIINSIQLLKLKKKYNNFMIKLGEGENIENTLKQYMEEVDKVNKENIEIKNYCKQLEKNITKCIQRIGLIRYSAFKDTGSDLSFTLALLNEENTGIVLNGIYSREMSNIYSKPVQKGISTYTLSEEEKAAIEKAMNNK